MKISVITVSYNAGDTIADTMKSVLAQDYSNYEHIIVDGGSTDRTTEIVRDFRHAKVKVICEPDQGLYDAMNKGIGVATGDLIGFLNADDFFCRTDALRSLALAAMSYSNAAAIAAGVVIVDHDRPSRVRRVYSATAFRRWMLRFGHMPPHPGFYTRFSAFDVVGLFDTSLKIGSDFEWMVRFFYRHGLVAEPMAQYMVSMRAGGLSTRGLHSMRIINAEAYRSLAKNNVWTAGPLIWSKYFLKSFQILVPPSSYLSERSARWMPD